MARQLRNSLLSNGGIMENKELTVLKDIAKQMRRHIITMLGEAGSGHPGGSLSFI